MEDRFVEKWRNWTLKSDETFGPQFQLELRLASVLLHWCPFQSKL